MEHVISSSNGLHGNHLYASIAGYAVDQPIPLTKSSHDIGVRGTERSVISGTLERQQVRQLVAHKESIVMVFFVVAFFFKKVAHI